MLPVIKWRFINLLGNIKKSTAFPLFNQIPGVCKSNETVLLVFDILLTNVISRDLLISVLAEEHYRSSCIV